MKRRRCIRARNGMIAAPHGCAGERVFSEAGECRGETFVACGAFERFQCGEGEQGKPCRRGAILHVGVLGLPGRRCIEVE